MSANQNQDSRITIEAAEEADAQKALARHRAMQKIKPLLFDPERKRFEYTTKINTTVFEMGDTKCEYKRLLFSALQSAHYLYFQTDNYSESRYKNFYLARRFWSFIENMDSISSSTRRTSNVIKEFEAFHVEECNIISTAGTGVQYLTKLLSHVLDFDDFYNYLSQSEVAYLHALTKTKASRLDGKKPNNLNFWFSSKTWLRVEAGHDIYSRLGSPQKLMLSFRITAEEALLSLQEAKLALYEFFKHCGITIDDLPTFISKREMDSSAGKILTDGTHKRHAQHCYYSFLALLRSKLQGVVVTKTLRFSVSVIICSLVKSSSLDRAFSYVLNECGEHRISIEDMRYEHSRKAGFSLALIGDIVAQAGKNNPVLPISDFERILAGWCLAYLAIPTQGVESLTPQNFGYLERNDNRKINVQVTYYKTRAGRNYTTAPVDAKSPLGRALINHVDNITQFEGGNALVFNIKDHALANLNSAARKLACLLSTSPLEARIKAKHKHDGAVHMFPPLFLASLTSNRVNVGNIFGLNTIKTSAVYSRSLSYDLRNIINYESHTNETHDTSYLVELNEEWENLGGRITRAVFQDLASNVFRDSKRQTEDFKSSYMDAINEVETRRDEMTNSFKVITERSDGWVNDLGVYEGDTSEVVNSEFPDAILILDSSETVVRMKHFLAELEEHWKKISQVSPMFFMKTALPQAEFMEMLFESNVFSDESLSKGEALYQKFKHTLPPCLSSYY